ncbi:MAG: dTMP kinase [Candidatus Omnitrophica bacterium]|nr:dTMP kinase [Candidatus Omnitrophota bacterium]
MKGYFITFEGPEKSGKSTQGKLLKKYLTKKGFSCLFIREPGSTTLSEKIRKILLDKKNIQLSHFTEMLLYMAARSQLIKDVIEPALKKNKVVICDRFIDSTIAYQGYGLGLDINLIKKIGKSATKGIKPDITILLDLNDKDSLFKENHKKDRIELRSDNYHKRVKRGYLLLSKLYPKRIKVVRVKDNIFSTQKEIRRLIDKCLLKK